MCCNRIKHVHELVFSKAYKLISVDFSYNEIEFIHPMAFNGTAIKFLALRGNPLSSLEVNLNQTASFLDSIASTILSLSCSHCTKLVDIKWLAITKLRSLGVLDLSGIPKTDQLWSYRVINNDSVVEWSDRPSIVLHGLQLTDHDYCLSKSITHILNDTIYLVIILMHAIVWYTKTKIYLIHISGHFVSLMKALWKNCVKIVLAWIQYVAMQLLCQTAINGGE